MKSVVFVLLLPMLLVKVSLAERFPFDLCPESECGCKRPKDIDNRSEKVKDMSFRYGCICICACTGSQECGRDEDCAVGFDCRQDGRKKKCVCPCDDMHTPYCPSLYSKCNMVGIEPTCECSQMYVCNEEVLLPECVIWDNRTACEYANPCFFVKETCDKSRDYGPRKEFPHSCERVPNLLNYMVHSKTYHGMTLYELSEDPFANPAVLGWDPNPNHHRETYGMFMPWQRPEPEPEPEAEPYIRF